MNIEDSNNVSLHIYIGKICDLLKIAILILCWTSSVQVVLRFGRLFYDWRGFPFPESNQSNLSDSDVLIFSGGILNIFFGYTYKGDSWFMHFATQNKEKNDAHTWSHDC